MMQRVSQAQLSDASCSIGHDLPLMTCSPVHDLMHIRRLLACRKILKKHDKMTTTTLMGTLMPRVAEMLSKEQRKAALEGLKNNVVHEYGLLAVEGNEEQAEQDLSRYQRDQLTFERNTGQSACRQQNAQQVNVSKNPHRNCQLGEQ